MKGGEAKGGKNEKFLVSLIVVALFISLSDISFAQKVSSAPAKTVQSKIETLSGKIISIDNTKKQVTIQEKRGVEKTFTADAKQIATLKTNESIEVTLKSGSNTAETIKDITRKHNKT